MVNINGHVTHNGPSQIVQGVVVGPILNLNSINIFPFRLHFGLFSPKLKEESCPAQVHTLFEVPSEEVFTMMRGMVNTDGHVTHNGPSQIVQGVVVGPILKLLNFPFMVAFWSVFPKTKAESCPAQVHTLFEVSI